MEQALQTLREIIIRAIPTFVLFFFLYWFLRKVLFQPLEEVLRKRREATEGAVAAAEASLAQVDEQLAAYERALSDARTEIYKAQEQQRLALLAAQNQTLDEVRWVSAASVSQAKESLAAEVAAARDTLGAESDRLASQIAASILAGRAA
jgi:F-type H+-transporting ATPase subunit b